MEKSTKNKPEIIDIIVDLRQMSNRLTRLSKTAESAYKSDFLAVMSQDLYDCARRLVDEFNVCDDDYLSLVYQLCSRSLLILPDDSPSD